MDSLQVPCAFCKKCDEFGPVVVEQIKKGDWIDMGTVYDGEDLIVVYCPGCMSLINLDGGVEVQWFDAEDLPKATGWEINDTSSGQSSTE